MKIRIEGLATCASPLHIAVPGDHRVDQNGKFVANQQATPCTRVQTMPVLSVEDGETQQTYLPNIPANSVRGRLRRAAANLVQDALVSRGIQMTLQSYNCLRCGAPHGYPAKKPPTLPETVAAHNHLFYGIFGGSPKMYRANVVTDTGFPVTAEAVAAGVVPDRYADRAVGRIEKKGGGSFTPSLTSVIFSRRNDDALMFNDPNAERVIANYAESVEDWREIASETVGDVADASDDQANGKGKAKKVFRGPQGFRAMELVHPGTPFFIRIEAELDLAQAGLFLQAVVGLQNTPMGGQVRNGFGRLHWDLVVTLDDVPYRPYQRVSGEPVTLDTSDPAIAALVKACDDALDTLDIGAMEAIASAADGDVAKARNDAMASVKARREATLEKD